jgi:glucokinase
MSRKETMRIVAFDIGGTNGRGLRFATNGRKPKSVGDITKFLTGAYSCLEDALRDQFTGDDVLDDSTLCFALPGPVETGVCNTTNLPWVVQRESVAARLGLELERVLMLNDFAAAAHGVPEMTGEDLYTLNPGQCPAQGNLALLGPGTGLGEAGLYFNGTTYQPFPTEGGHTNFGPFNLDTAALSTWLLQNNNGPVSVEMVASGPGLVEILEFVRARDGEDTLLQWLEETIDREKPIAISRRALDGDGYCMEALALFLDIVFAEAGNLTLKLGAWRGCYIWGGILPSMLPLIETSKERLLALFRNKGKNGCHSKLLEKVPLHIITNDQLALVGAAAFAAGQLT